MRSEAICEGMITNTEYPKLMKSITELGIIVLFTREEHGTLVWQDEGKTNRLGESSASWDMKKFIPWYGTIAITTDLPSIILGGDDEEDLAEE